MSHNAKKKTQPKHKPQKQKKKSSLGRKILTAGGAALGGLFGLGEAGRTAGDAFADILGMGSYRVKSNTFSLTPDAVPMFDHHADGSVTITHRELITDVTMYTNFTYSLYNIDPTAIATFPWLAGVAVNYEQYEFLGLVFVYKKTSANAVSSTNPSLGAVVFATEYDVSRQPFASKTEMEAYEFSTSCVPSEVMYHPIECNPRQDVLNSRYVTGVQRSTKWPISIPITISNALTSPSTAGGVAANLNMLGRFQLATVGAQAQNVSGELWVVYKIRLMKPRMPATGTIGGYFHCGSGGLATLSTGSSVFGGAVTVYSDSNSIAQPITLDTAGTAVYFTGLQPKTKIIMSYSLVGTSGTVNLNARSISNLIPDGIFFNNPGLGTGSNETVSGSGTQTLTYTACWQTNDNTYTSPTWISFANPGITSTASWDLTIHLVTTSTPAITALTSSGEEIAEFMRELRVKRLKPIKEEKDSDGELL